MSDKGRKVMVKVVCVILVIGLLGSSLLYLLSAFGWI